MAGLVAAARARELGAKPVVFEKGDRAGGSMLLSSGVIWRHRTLDEFGPSVPAASRRCRRGSSTSSTTRSTGSSRSGSSRCGARRATRSRSAGATTLGCSRTPSFAPQATCGCGSRSPRRRYSPRAASACGSRASEGYLLRAAPWSEGDGLDYALARVPATTTGMEEFYGRALPAAVGEADFVRAPRSSTPVTRSCSTTRAEISATAPGTRATSSSASRPGGRGTSSMPAALRSRCGSGRWPTSSRPRACCGR